MSFRCDAWKAALGPRDAEPLWQTRLAGTSALRTQHCRRLVVATAHLDEDVCSAGGLISALGARSVPVEVLAVTDGDGTAQDALDIGHAAELGYRRAHRPTAYHRLGSYRTRCHDLRLPSGAVGRKERDVVAALSEIVGYAPEPSGLWILAPWHHDGHPDHDAVGRAAVAVARAYRVRLLQYLTAAWRHEEPPPDLPWSRCRQLPLTPLQCARKLRATASPIRRGGRIGDRELFLADQIEGTAHR